MGENNHKIVEYILATNEDNHLQLEELNCKNWSGELTRNGQIAEMLRKLFHMDSLAIERGYIIAFDDEASIKGVCLVGQGSERQVDISTADTVKFLSLIKATQFIFVHNHPRRSITPSEADNNTTVIMQKISDWLGIDFVGSMIIGGKNHSMHGGFEKNKKIKEILNAEKEVFERLETGDFEDLDYETNGIEYLGSGNIVAEMGGCRVEGTIEEVKEMFSFFEAEGKVKIGFED